jgi:hypothetical protein
LTNTIACNFDAFCPNPASFEFGLDGDGNYSLSSNSKYYKERSILSKKLTKKILATSSNLTCLSVILCEGEVEFIDKHINYY